MFRYLILHNFLASYLPVLWPWFIKIYDIYLLSVVFPIFLGALFLTPSGRALGPTREKARENNYLLLLGLTVLFILRFLILNIDRAQVNISILMLLLFAVYYLMKKRDIAAGVYLGIAVIFKLAPAIFFVYLFLKKRFKALFSSIATCIILLFIPCFKWGIKENSRLLGDWLGVLRSTLPSEYLQHKNQSLMAAISRFFSENSDISVLRLGQIHLTGLVILAYAAVIGILIFSTMRKSKAPPNEAMRYDLALFFVSMTLLSPVGTKTTFIYLALPVALLIREAFKRSLKDKPLNMGLLTYVSLIYLNSRDIIGDFSVTLHKYSLFTLCLILIGALIIYARNSLPRA
jgi:hypothetical protein